MSVMLPTHVVDCGACKSTVYVVAADEVLTFGHGELLNFLMNLPSGSFVYGEYSHLGCPRTDFSLSQPYPKELLLELYSTLRENGIKLRFFPQKSTPRASAYAGLPKSDENDPKSIYVLVKDFPEIVKAAMKPPKTFDLCPKRAESYKYKKYTDAYINMARREQPQYTTDQCSIFLRENIKYLYDNLSPEARDAFGLSYFTEKGQLKPSVYARDTKNGKKGDFNFEKVNLIALYAIACTIIDPQGEVRVRSSTGELPGWQYIKKYILRMSPNHLKGGVARSNLYFWGKKNWIIKKAKKDGVNLKGKSRGGFWAKTKEKEADFVKEGTRFSKAEDEVFLKYRKIFCDSIREVWQLIRDMKVENRGSACHSVESEFRASP